MFYLFKSTEFHPKQLLYHAAFYNSYILQNKLNINSWPNLFILIHLQVWI